MNFQNMGNLTTLICSDIRICMSDDVLQNILRDLTLLKHITIHISETYDQNYLQMSDYGFTGDSEDHIGYSISDLIFLETLDFHNYSSILGNPTLFHISLLKQLKHLDIFCSMV